MTLRLNLRGHLGFPIPKKVDKKRYDIVGNIGICLDKNDEVFQKEIKAFTKLPRRVFLSNFLIHSRTMDLVYKKFRKEIGEDNIDFAKLCNILVYYNRSKKCYVGCFDFDLLKEVKK